jgi:YidC/Oxa1 family membrane protein insertase
MKGCLFIAQNEYLWALLLFALIVEVLLLPLSIKQQKSQIQMAKVKPKEIAIREKYNGRNDKVTQQKMSMEIQEMYQQSGYNPFSGCLPLLIQLPIILVLFNIVRQPVTFGARLIDDNDKFETDYYEELVVFYQEEKEALDKSAFESEADYNAYVTRLETYQKELGAKEDGTVEVNGTELKNYVFDEDGLVNAKKSSAEIVLVRFMNDGKENVNNLIEEGKINQELNEDFKLELIDELEEYKEKLPQYRVGPVSLVETPDMSPEVKQNYWLLIIPLLVFLTSFFTTKLTRKVSGNIQTDANGNPVGGGLFMEVGMPLISAMFTFMFSAAVGAYWVWRSLIGMGKTVILAKAMPIPQVTKEQIAEAKRALKAKPAKKKKVITIEVDEDDDSYDQMIVKKSSVQKTEDPLKRTPRKVEMLTADDDEDQN